MTLDLRSALPAHLKEESLLYAPQEISLWQSNSDSCIDILVKSNVPLPIKRSIAYRKGIILDDCGRYESRRTRNGKPYYPRKTMHFDVAKAAVSLSGSCRAGWYGSYDWLTEPGWTASPRDFVPHAEDANLFAFKKEYQEALIVHIGMDRLKDLQAAAGRLPSVTPPDLWFISSDGTHLFVEAKLDRKTTEDTQIAGLALLKMVLGADVRIVRVHDNKGTALNDFTDKFRFYCNLL